MVRIGRTNFFLLLVGLAMAKGLSAQEQAAKWAANAGAATQNYKNGVMKVTQSPTQKAANNLQAAVTNFTAAVNNGTMAAKLNAVSLQQWQQSASTKGGNNYANGVQAGLPKMQAALAKWVPIRNAIQSQVAAMPNASYADRKARMNAMVDGMHAAKATQG